MLLSEIMCGRSFHQKKQQLQPEEEKKEAALEREAAVRTTHCWSKSSRTRRTAGGGGRRQLRHHPRRAHTRMTSLRPVNVKGNSARGMRAPKNTNQFLMHEKYQMQHMRSDSVGSDCSCRSNSDVDLTDMDSYLGALENARGALLDSPKLHDSTSPLRRFVVLHPDAVCLNGKKVCSEDSMQYFPSEQDLMQSQNFMQKDFAEFCNFLYA